MMNAKGIIILLACLCYAHGCGPSCNGGSCNHHNSKRSIVDDKIPEKEKGTIDIQLKDSHYLVKLQGDPCNFETYDKNRDGIISLGELVDFFGIDMIRTGVFKDLDVLKDDGAITPWEFDDYVPLIIPECKHLS